MKAALIVAQQEKLFEKCILYDDIRVDIIPKSLVQRTELTKLFTSDLIKLYQPLQKNLYVTRVAKGPGLTRTSLASPYCISSNPLPLLRTT